MKLRALIIDDEQPARELIQSYLTEFEKIELVGICSNGFEGIKAIQKHNPDLIFLDIQMPKLSGFEMLELLDEYPRIIFSTAFDEFAIKAFDHNAVDYLLKPYSKERFNQAIAKVLEKNHPDKNNDEKVRKTVANRLPEGTSLDRIVVKSGTKIIVIPIDDVEYLKSDDDYVEIHTKNERYLKQQRMKYFEETLNPKSFIRVHRSYIVKISEVVQLEPYEKDSKILILKSGAKVHVSQTGMKLLKETLGF